jgi:hypothetical protein
LTESLEPAERLLDAIPQSLAKTKFYFPLLSVDGALLAVI